MRLKTIWWVTASLLAVLVAILVVVRLQAFAVTWPAALVMVLIGASPIALAASARAVMRGRASDVVRWLCLSAGVVLVVGGLLLVAVDRFLMLRLALNDWRILARATTATAPLGLLALGVAWMTTAVGVARRQRAWFRGAAAIVGLTALWFAASFAAASAWRVRADTDLLVDGGGIAAAVAIALAGVLAVAAPWAAGAGLVPATTPPPDESSEPPAPSGWAEPQRHPRARLVVAGLAAVLLIGGAIAVWIDRGDRLALADAFPDAALATCVANAVGAGRIDAKVSRADLADVLALECPGPGRSSVSGPPTITDLTGLEQLTNLSTLDVTGNAVTDLTPLADLDLWGVVITDNPVSDLSPLAGMPTLTNLGASRTQVVDLTPLAGNSTLAYLGLQGTGISDIGPLASMVNLHEVTLSDNAISDVGPLAGHEYLTSLDLARNEVTDVGALGQLPQLWTLDVSGNQVADLASIPAFPTLHELWLGENPLTDVTPLTTLPALVGVDLTGAAGDLPGIANLRDAGVYVGGLA